MSKSPDFAAYLDLIEQYRDKFGDVPPVLWNDTDKQISDSVDKMRQAIETGKPWVRTELENIPEGVLL